MSGSTGPEWRPRPRLTVVGADHGRGGDGASTDGPAASGTGVERRLASPGPRSRAGWRGRLHRASRGRLRLRVTAADRELADRLGRVVAQLGGWHAIAVVGSKGGVGRSTIAAGLGQKLAQARGDHVIAVDAHPEVGTLAGRLLGATPTAPAGDLLAQLGRIQSHADLAAFTGRVGNLDVLASSHRRDAPPGALGAVDYHRLVATLSRFYNIILTDTAALLEQPATLAAVAQADTIVVAATASVDGAAAADRTLDWLRRHEPALAGEAIVVLSGHHSHPQVDRRALRGYLAARCRAVVEIPADPHLAGGGPLDPTRLQPRTSAAFLSLAAHVADQFRWGLPDRARGIRAGTTT